MQLEHGFFEHSLGEKLFEPEVFLLQRCYAFDHFRFHATVEVVPAVVGGLSDFKHVADVTDGLILGIELISRFQLEDDVFGNVTGSFHDEV
jgi:hypothetical protein